jgi:hypothetical protein
MRWARGCGPAHSETCGRIVLCGAWRTRGPCTTGNGGRLCAHEWSVEAIARRERTHGARRSAWPSGGSPDREAGRSTRGRRAHDRPAHRPGGRPCPRARSSVAADRSRVGRHAAAVTPSPRPADHRLRPAPRVLLTAPPGRSAAEPEAGGPHPAGVGEHVGQQDVPQAAGTPGGRRAGGAHDGGTSRNPARPREDGRISCGARCQTVNPVSGHTAPRLTSPRN